MSGHSKWSTIKHKKALADAKRGTLFGKLARAISVAAKDNPDPETNAQLRDTILRARASNMPKDKIEGAIKKVADKNAAALHEIQFEFLGPGEAAVIVTGITDNSNRTAGELKKLAADHGGRMVNPGSVSWMFKKAVALRGRIADNAQAQQLAIIDAGADDVSNEEGELYIEVNPEKSQAVKAALGDLLIDGTLTFIATTPHVVPDQSTQLKLRAFLDALDDHEDIQEVSTNADL